MQSDTRRSSCVVWVGLVMAVILATGAPAIANDAPACTIGQERKVHKGLRIAPVPLDMSQKNRALVGLGSYIVNTQGACIDCHSTPPYAEGGDPFQGQPPVINADGYLAGGTMFGPFMARNITPCQDGKPAGLTQEEFIRVMRTGVDLKDDLLPPGETPLLQVMPWPIQGLMTYCDLRAIYEYLRAIPPHAGCVPASVQDSRLTQ